MKNFILKKIWVAAVLVLAVSCIDDKGHYDYIPIDELHPVSIEIDGIEDGLVFIANQTVRITPNITGLGNESDYEFVWYLFEYPNMGYRDTIGTSRNLEYTVKKPLGTYRLIYQVKPKDHDSYVDMQCTVSIQSMYSKGWFVVEDDGSTTDVDMITPDGILYENIVSSATGQRVPGQASDFNYCSNWSYTTEDSEGTLTTYSGLKVFYVSTKEDIHVLDAEIMVRYQTFEEIFYDLPARRDIQSLIIDNTDIYLVNDGKMYYLGAGGKSPGLFMGPCYGLGYDDYSLHSDIVYDYNALHCFDRTKNSFVYFRGWDIKFGNYMPPQATDFDGVVTDMNVSMVKQVLQKQEYIGAPVYGYVNHAYAIMESGGNHYIYKMGFAFGSGTAAFPLSDVIELPVDCKVQYADVMCSTENGNVIYFADDNKLIMHEVKQAPDEPGFVPDPSFWEFDRYTFPAGETVAYLEHIKPYGTAWDHLIALTNSASGWKIYAIPFRDGSFEIDPEGVEVIGSGNGVGRKVILR